MQQYGFSGSLVLTNRKVEEQAYSPVFSLGNIGDSRGFIHIFNDEGFELVMGVLDTAAEFSAYLSAREKLFQADLKPFLALGEEQILALYLNTQKNHNRLGFVIPGGRDAQENTDVMVMDFSLWQGVQESEFYEHYLARRENSYLWDNLINQLGNLLLRESTLEEKLSVERLLRVMASEPRPLRQTLSNQLVEMLSATADVPIQVRKACPRGEPAPVFVLMATVRPEGVDDSTFLQTRFNLLINHSKVAKLFFPDSNIFVGVGVGPNGGNEPVIASYIDFTNWSEAQQNEAVQLREQFESKSGRFKWKSPLDSDRQDKV